MTLNISTRRRALACSLALLSAAASAQASTERCTALVGARFGHGAVTSVKSFAPGREKASTAMCRAQVRLQPTPNSDIRAEVWLPEQWNGKLLSWGGGGFSGGIAQSEGFMNTAAANGYATTTSDIGHVVSATARWAHKNPDKVVDFGHRANHLIAVASKQLIQAFYRTPVLRAYFQGCSGGGREALMEANRYPEDYDGIIAGSPAMNFGEIMAQMIWNEQVLTTAPKLLDKLPLVNKAVMQACDGVDGVEDGVLENPQQCRFDPAVLACKAFDTQAWLNKAETSALRKLYEGPRLKSGELLISGPAVGSEGAGWVLSSIMTAIGGPEFYRWMVYDDPRWQVGSFDLDRDYPYARLRAGSVIDSSKPDLTAFTQRGGKLILYHGWADTLISANNTVRYYEKAREALGPNMDQSARLFMVPGFQHCGEGLDVLPALEAWVEKGQAPEQAILKGKKRSGPFGLLGETETTRLLCPWPKTARYKGSGPTGEAASFSCQ